MAGRDHTTEELQPLAVDDDGSGDAEGSPGVSAGAWTALALGLVLLVQLSTASLWWTFGYGLPLLVLDAVLVGGFAVGPALQAVAQSDGADDAVGLRLGTTGTIVASVVAVAATLLTAIVARRSSPGCGSPLSPTDYDCVPVPGTATTMLTALVAVVAAGLVAGSTRRRPRFLVPIPPSIVLGALTAVCVTVALGFAPRTRPSGGPGADAQRAALDAVVGPTKSAALALAAAVVAIGVAALARSLPNRRVPLATLAALVVATVAGALAVAPTWIAVLADFLKGP